MTNKAPKYGKTLEIQAGSLHSQQLLKALASKPRLRILELLNQKLCNISEIAEELDIPLSTANRDIAILEEAKLIRSEFLPATRGLQKVCSRVYDKILIDLPFSDLTEDIESSIEIDMPIGAYTAFDIEPTCGLCGKNNIIGLFDNPQSFYEPNHINAQLLWFHSGYLEYVFPNKIPPQNTLTALRLSLEMCSEAPLHHKNWPSDITLWINNVEIGTWNSPADFGGKRGQLTPSWWGLNNTQYGLLKMWQVNTIGSFIDGTQISSISLKDLNLNNKDHISMKIGIKKDAKNVGGINLFGKFFGNYPQDIRLALDYKETSNKNKKTNPLIL